MSIISKFRDLFTGNLIAQLVPILFAPVLLSLYNLESFASLGLFLAVVNILSLISVAKLDVASFVVSPPHQYTTSFISINSVITGVLASIIVIILRLDIVELAIIPTTFLISSYRYYYGLKNSEGNTHKMAQVKVVRQVSIVIIQALMYSFENGLIFGILIGEFISYITVVKLEPIYISKKEYLEVYTMNMQYVKYSVIADLFNNVALYIPIFYFEYIQSTMMLGAFTVLNRYIIGPISLLSGVFSEIFRSSLFDRNNKINIGLDIRWFLILAIICLLILFTSMALRDFIFMYYLRMDIDVWYLAYIFMLGIGLIRFLVSPFTHYYFVLKKNNYDLIWQLINLIIVLNILFVFSDRFSSIWLALFSSVLIGYTINMIFIVRLVYNGRSNFS